MTTTPLNKLNTSFHGPHVQLRRSHAGTWYHLQDVLKLLRLDAKQVNFEWDGNCIHKKETKTSRNGDLWIAEAALEQLIRAQIQTLSKSLDLLDLRDLEHYLRDKDNVCYCLSCREEDTAC